MQLVKRSLTLFWSLAATLNLSKCRRLTLNQRGAWGRVTRKTHRSLETLRSGQLWRKYNKIGADKVRKSRTSYENIYHSRNFWPQRGLELICVFLRGGALRCRMGNSPQPGTFWAAAYSQFIRACNKNHEGWGEIEWEGLGSEVERGNPEVGPRVIRRRTTVLNQTHSSAHLRYVVWAHLSPTSTRTLDVICES